MSIISDTFDTFISRLIPGETENQKAKSHRSSVKACLENRFECYGFFESGSFGNRTSVKGFSDTDYFALIPDEIASENSNSMLVRFKTVLQRKYYLTKIRISCPAVKINFGTYASEKLEVIPAVIGSTYKNKLGEFPSYHIPNCNEGWMLSSPLAHNAYVTYHNKRLAGKLKPLIRLIKAWKYYNHVPISSFYLELRVTKRMEAEKNIIFPYDIYNVFEYLRETKLAKMRDPMGISGYILPTNSEAKYFESLSKVNSAFIRSGHGLHEYIEQDYEDSYEWFDKLFSYKLPAL
ncbi:MAG: SMODS domain-containing nucleotidyltransferase [Candidatus Sericytochromatia bacterium]